MVRPRYVAVVRNNFLSVSLSVCLHDKMKTTCRTVFIANLFKIKTKDENQVIIVNILIAMQIDYSDY